MILVPGAWAANGLRRRIAVLRGSARWIAALSLFVVGASFPTKEALGDVLATLDSGRWMAADELSSDSDAAAAVFTITRPGISLSRRVPWSRIVRVSQNGREYSMPEIREAVLGRSTISPAPLAPATHADRRDSQRSRPQPTGVVPASANGEPHRSRLQHAVAVAPPRDRLRGSQPNPAVLASQVSPWPLPLPYPNVDGYPLISPPPPSYVEPVTLLNRGVVVGIRQDPLSAYPDLEAQLYPAGIPQYERGFALQLFRSIRINQSLGYPLGFLPGAPLLGPPGFGPAFFGNNATQPPSSSTHNTSARNTTRNAAERPINPPISSALRTPPSAILSGVSAHAVPFSQAGGVDWDSLLVQLSAYDTAGRPLPVPSSGTVTATLTGQRQQLVHSIGGQFFGQPLEIERIATWTESFGQDVAGQGGVAGLEPCGARVVLPLPRPLPEHDVRRFPFADLHVEVTIPGQGTYETVQSGIPLVHASLMRDQLRWTSGSQFFANERTTDGRQNAGPAFQPFSNSSPDSRIFTIQP